MDQHQLSSILHRTLVGHAINISYDNVQEAARQEQTGIDFLVRAPSEEEVKLFAERFAENHEVRVYWDPLYKFFVFEKLKSPTCQYQSLFFARGNDAEFFLSFLYTSGAEALIEYLLTEILLRNDSNGETKGTSFADEEDFVAVVGNYRLMVNERTGYVGLEKKLD